MLELWRIRAILADLPLQPAESPVAGVAAIESAIGKLAASDAVEVRRIGSARDGSPIWALGLAPPDGLAAPGVLVVGVPRGDAPTGAQALIALARRLRADPGLRASLGVRWWLVPCLDPAGARRNADWWAAPLSVESYARGVGIAPLDEQPDALTDSASSEQRALRELIATVQPQRVLFLYDAPTGGFALHADGGLWEGREGDVVRLLDPLGLPLALGGDHGSDAATAGAARAPLTPPSDASLDPYARFRADLVRPIGTLLSHLGASGLATGAVVAPLFVDYERRERDMTLAAASRRAVGAEGIRLWREWFAFGRTALDLIAPQRGGAVSAESPTHRALLAALRGADTILAEGLRWPALIGDPDAPATIAETFAHGDAIRLARLVRLASLVRFLREATGASAPVASESLAATLDRALETQTRWIDELAVPGTLRPTRRDRAIGAQLALLLLALP